MSMNNLRTASLQATKPGTSQIHIERMLTTQPQYCMWFAGKKQDHNPLLPAFILLRHHYVYVVQYSH
jgi:hypothetical protein